MQDTLLGDFIFFLIGQWNLDSVQKYEFAKMTSFFLNPFS